VICVYDDARKAIETHEHKGDQEAVSVEIQIGKAKVWLSAVGVDQLTPKILLTAVNDSGEDI